MTYADNCCTCVETYDGNKHFYVYSGKCAISGKPVTVKVPGAELFAYRQGALIQNAMPSVPAGEREFLMTGISEESWAV